MIDLPARDNICHGLQEIRSTSGKHFRSWDTLVYSRTGEALFLTFEDDLAEQYRLGHPYRE